MLGAFGRVYLDENTNPPRAIKYAKKLYSSEVKILKKMSDIGIAPEVYSDLKRIDKANQAYAMEFIKGETLVNKFEKNKPQDSDFNDDLFGDGLTVTVPKDTFVSILQLRKKMHENGIAHLDMHAGNIMVTDKGDIKVFDTGLATQNNPYDLIKDIVGGAFYVSTSDESLSKKYNDAINDVRRSTAGPSVKVMTMKEGQEVINNFYKKVLSDV